MKTSSEGVQQCTNAQVAVDGKNQMIVATVVGRGATDQGQLLPMVDAAAACPCYTNVRLTRPGIGCIL